MQELLWIASGVGWGIAAGYIYGHRRGLAAAPENLRSLQLDVSDALDKLNHKADRVRHREKAAAAAEQPEPAGEVLPGDRKSEIRRRAADFFHAGRRGVVNNAGAGEELIR